MSFTLCGQARSLTGLFLYGPSLSAMRSGSWVLVLLSDVCTWSPKLAVLRNRSYQPLYKFKSDNSSKRAKAGTERKNLSLGLLDAIVREAVLYRSPFFVSSAAAATAVGPVD